MSLNYKVTQLFFVITSDKFYYWKELNYKDKGTFAGINITLITIIHMLL